MRGLGAVTESWKVWGKYAIVPTEAHRRRNHIETGCPQAVNQDNWWSFRARRSDRLTTEYEMAVNRCPGTRQ
jgi:hypothetical protein